MRLTTFSDYALRLLILCASRSPEQVTIAEAAAVYKISRNHLMRIASELSKGGFIRSVRGRNGGLILAVPATEISIGDVVRLTERSSELVECFNPENNRCVIAQACGLKPVLATALDAFYAKLDEWSLADIMRRRENRLKAALWTPLEIIN